MAVLDPSTWLLLQRRVRFGDTDAAGVMHFHQLLRWCHEAYEESLERFGIAAAAVFPTPGEHLAVALPIVHCSADFRRPLVCGDALAIALEPQRLERGRFEIRYRFRCANPGPAGSADPRQTVEGPAAGERLVAEGLTSHLAIEAATRRRCDLPEPIERWLEASSLGQGPRPL